MLYSWVTKYYPNRKQIADNSAPESEELKRLRKEAARLKQERDISKKAAAYFASEMVLSTCGLEPMKANLTSASCASASL